MFSKEEKNFIYKQLGGRKDYFKEDLKIAANENNFKRVEQCYNAIKLIDKIQRKLLGVL